MKLKVVKGTIDNKLVGEIIEVKDDADAQRLINLGYAEKAEGGKPEKKAEGGKGEVKEGNE